MENTFSDTFKLLYDETKLFCSEEISICEFKAKYMCSRLNSNANHVVPTIPLKSSKQCDLDKDIQNTLTLHGSFKSENHYNDMKTRGEDFISNLIKNIHSSVKPSTGSLHKLKQSYKKRQDSNEHFDLSTIKGLQENEKNYVYTTYNRYLKYRSHFSIEPTNGENAGSFSAPYVNDSINEVITDPLQMSSSSTVVDCDCIIKIKFYQPFIHVLGKTNIKGHPKFEKEIELPSSCTLKMFRNFINCRQDKDTGEDISDDFTKDTAPNDLGQGLFYINGTLYSDDRFPYPLDDNYPEYLEQWGKSKRLKIKHEIMGNLKFDDLTVRLGYPQLYQHRGSCEHMFLISDLMIPATNKYSRSHKFPLICSLSMDMPMNCGICSKFTATWVTIGNVRAIKHELYWCETCFQRFNYNKDNVKIGEFHAYRYNHFH